jgi:CCR4-NOT transcription complex subunit 2
LLPACYGVHVQRVHQGVFQKFQQETLFYVFYSMPGDEAQLYAADELIARGWGYHKELKAWLMRVANTEPVMKTDRGERGSFWIFDASSWERVRKDNFNLQYDQLEVRPQVPRGGAVGGGKDGPGKESGGGGGGGGALLNQGK